MNLDSVPRKDNPESQTSHGYASSQSDIESDKLTSSSRKTRASRAGTRGITTLSPAQLERKRANDREAQRAVRQRTKDYIKTLEISIGELRSSQESQKHVVAATQRRHRELNEENVYLRCKLLEAGYAVNIQSAQTQRQPNTTLLSTTSMAPSTQASDWSVQRSCSAATQRYNSEICLQLPSSCHGLLQQPGTYMPSPPSSFISASSANSLATTPNLTKWRSHIGGSSVHATTVQAQEAQGLSRNAYTPGSPCGRVEGSAVPQVYQYPVNHERERSQQYDSPTSPPPPAQQSQQYIQEPVQGYEADPYHPPQVLPQADFQNTAVSNSAPYQSGPAAYHVQLQLQQQSTYQQTYQSQGYNPASYRMTLTQHPRSATEYVSAQSHMQPPPIHHNAHSTPE